MKCEKKNQETPTKFVGRNSLPLHGQGKMASRLKYKDILTIWFEIYRREMSLVKCISFYAVLSINTCGEMFHAMASVRSRT